MQNQSLVFCRRSRGQFSFARNLHGQFICLRFYGITKIDNIRERERRYLKYFFVHIVPGGINIELRNLFSFGVLWCSGIEHHNLLVRIPAFLQNQGACFFPLMPHEIQVLNS